VVKDCGPKLYNAILNCYRSESIGVLVALDQEAYVTPYPTTFLSPRKLPAYSNPV
jgi:hypothetical protein